MSKQEAKKKQFIYKADVDVNEMLVTKGGKKIPRYMGRERPDGLLTDTLTGRSITPLNGGSMVNFQRTTSGVVIRNHIEEQIELNRAASG